MSEIRELTRRTEPRHQRSGYHSSAVYNETWAGGLPWWRETDQPCPTKEEAFAAARQWAVEYEAKDRYGNMATAIGVIAEPAGGWRGVVNYFHSNT